MKLVEDEQAVPPHQREQPLAQPARPFVQAKESVEQNVGIGQDRGFPIQEPFQCRRVAVEIELCLPVIKLLAVDTHEPVVGSGVYPRPQRPLLVPDQLVGGIDTKGRNAAVDAVGIATQGFAAARGRDQKETQRLLAGQRLGSEIVHLPLIDVRAHVLEPWPGGLFVSQGRYIDGQGIHERFPFRLVCGGCRIRNPMAAGKRTLSSPKYAT